MRVVHQVDWVLLLLCVRVYLSNHLSLSSLRAALTLRRRL